MQKHFALRTFMSVLSVSVNIARSDTTQCPAYCYQITFAPSREGRPNANTNVLCIFSSHALFIFSCLYVRTLLTCTWSNGFYLTERILRFFAFLSPLCTCALFPIRKHSTNTLPLTQAWELPCSTCILIMTVVVAVSVRVTRLRALDLFL